MAVTVLAVLVAAGVVWTQRHYFFIAFPDSGIRGEFTNLHHVADRSPVIDRVIHVSVSIKPENCAGYHRGFFDIGSFGTPANAVGFLTGRTLERFELDHVVARHEAWCSGVHDPTFGTDSTNLRVADPAVCQGKDGHDPRELVGHE